jgi:phosphoribosylformylglycinamidine synthase
MAFAGELGARIDVNATAASGTLNWVARLFSESNSRFLCEVAAAHGREFEQVFEGVPVAKIGEVTRNPRLVMSDGGNELFEIGIFELKQAWQSAFDV